MAQTKFLDWLGIQYYDQKIKSWVDEKAETEDDAMEMLIEMDVLDPIADENGNVLTDENGNILTI